MVLLINLADAEAATSGGKAAVLARLLQAGLPIPPGFVIPTSAYEQADGDISADLVDEITQALLQIGDGYLAVRSSATSEDTAHATAAGQHDTFLGVRGPDEVADAVRRCWASLWSERAVAYRRRQGNAQSPTIAVLVQRLVDADVAGVMFTGDDTRLEASWGLGESVVSGHVTPDSWVVSGGAVTHRALGTKKTRIDRTVTREVEPADRDRLCLTDDEVTRLVQLGRQIADLLGGPQDIEWAISGSRIWILQSRPVTSALPAAHTVAVKESKALRGTPGSPGLATGPTRVVRGPADFPRVRPGDILVCRTTDPAWTPLFGVVAAVVTETGGLLSHAAIVAREQGLPAVLAIPDVTTALHDGAHVEVDGSTGRVTRLGC
ncbi:PEP/pyruvate-binding domain-containing protein [Solwaraspora sp. WMMA2056]|uniref:PEP/pyruvate-binding domain-containing protein n=1 Tax=Solwaraspora sp. WMMA2056 TaxID=3015161 RepID=UPI00259B2BC1|nr:PEP/pyruvate-binding domain-containing protein [Solwaraspora sp. WMMA2056]WJK41326.1 PEP/pyruvate-binding domain-containing protein [Solwaraspora sp. WMMA2056]